MHEFSDHFSCDPPILSLLCKTTFESYLPKPLKTQRNTCRELSPERVTQCKGAKRATIEFSTDTNLAMTTR
jgi:hypothetical protein